MIDKEGTSSPAEGGKVLSGIIMSINDQQWIDGDVRMTRAEALFSSCTHWNKLQRKPRIYWAVSWGAKVETSDMTLDTWAFSSS